MLYESEYRVLKNQGFKIIQQYIESWLKQDIALFTSTLHHDSIIKECNGHLFKGRDAHTRWFKEWNTNSNRVTLWKILSFSFDPEADTCDFGEKHENRLFYCPVAQSTSAF